MGRHIAVSPAGADALHPVGPVTDPRLFDEPVPVAQRRMEDGRAPLVPPRRASGAPRTNAACPWMPAARTGLGRPDTSTPDLRSASVTATARTESSTSAHRFPPVPVRTAPSSGATVPQVTGRSLLGPTPPPTTRQRYLRTGPVRTVTDAPAPHPGRTSRRRDTALAAAALAVVGAVSGAAALLPSNAADARAETRADPVATPMPLASGATGGLSRGQLKQAMRRYHHRTTSTGAAAAGALDRPSMDAATGPATPAPSESSSRPPATSSGSEPTATSSGSGPSSSSPPLAALPGVIGALPLRPSNLTSGTYFLRDFLSQSSGAVISGGSLRGAGVGRTVVAMRKYSSTKAGSVPGNGDNQGGLANPVNPLYLLRGVSDLEDVTVQGTEQGHLYNGLYMTGGNLVIKHVQVDDIPGDSSANPGETFAVGINRASGTGTVDDLTINGGSGALSSAAGLAINNSDADWNISDLTANDLRYSAGIALWQVRGTMNIRNYVQRGGARSLGAERMAGTVNLYDPKWSAGTTGHDVTYTWDGGYSGGSINFYYSSAAAVPNRKIVILTNKASGIAGSVHVYIGGVRQPTNQYVTVN